MLDRQLRGPMLDRQKVEAILRRRFAGASPTEIAAAANAIMGLDDEWEEVLDQSRALGYQAVVLRPRSQHQSGV